MFPHRRRRPTWMIPLVIAILIVGIGYAQRGRIRGLLERNESVNVPTALNRNQAQGSNANANINSPVANIHDDRTVLPEEINLNVPFTVQAPDANWDEEHGEFCEEASVLMVSRYFAGEPIPNSTNAEAGLQDIKNWEVANLGYHKDTTAAETARILREKFRLSDLTLINNPTIENLKIELAAGNPIIIPAAGRLLGNPNFRQPGPLYHMLVVKGYTRDGKFITNDPGTRKGADYVYDQSVLMNAIHDWNDGDVLNGQRVAIVVRGE